MAKKVNQKNIIIVAVIVTLLNLISWFYPWVDSVLLYWAALLVQLIVVAVVIRRIHSVDGWMKLAPVVLALVSVFMILGYLFWIGLHNASFWGS